MTMRLKICLLLLLFSTVLFSVPVGAQTLMMATTTSTDNTGLLDYLAPKFKKDTGITLKWTAVGTGKALELGKNCDADVLLVHAPAAEKRFIQNGYGVKRKRIMYNDFIIIGPPGDPADIRGDSLESALAKLVNQEVLFVSRGDDSGTNKKELQLWEQADIKLPDRAKWYQETGQGMLSTIRVAAEKNGYTLADRGTYIKYADNFSGNPPLEIMVQGEESLFNQYSVMAVDPERCSSVDFDSAQKFIKWITSGKVQKEIADYKLLGKKLFHPNAR